KQKLKNQNWRKGLTKETDIRVFNNAKSQSNNIKSGKTKNNWKDGIMSEETRRKISLKRSEFINNNPSWCKYYTINNGEKDIKVQGSYEKRLAEYFNKNNIKWDRKRINYNKVNHYTPDFYLIDYDIYIEAKGWLKDRDIIKMKKVINEYPNIKIKLLFDKEISELE